MIPMDLDQTWMINIDSCVYASVALTVPLD